jgi:hypothetical protein
MTLVEEWDPLVLGLDWHPNGTVLAVVGSDGYLTV